MLFLIIYLSSAAARERSRHPCQSKRNTAPFHLSFAMSSSWMFRACEAPWMLLRQNSWALTFLRATATSHEPGCWQKIASAARRPTHRGIGESRTGCRAAPNGASPVPAAPARRSRRHRSWHSFSPLGRTQDERGGPSGSGPVVVHRVRFEAPVASKIPPRRPRPKLREIVRI